MKNIFVRVPYFSTYAGFIELIIIYVVLFEIYAITVKKLPNDCDNRNSDKLYFDFIKLNALLVNDKILVNV